MQGFVITPYQKYMQATQFQKISILMEFYHDYLTMLLRLTQKRLLYIPFAEAIMQGTTKAVRPSLSQSILSEDSAAVQMYGIYIWYYVLKSVPLLHAQVATNCNVCMQQ